MKEFALCIIQFASWPIETYMVVNFKLLLKVLKVKLFHCVRDLESFPLILVEEKMSILLEVLVL